jgi:hypothetical protein
MNEHNNTNELSWTDYQRQLNLYQVRVRERTEAILTGRIDCITSRIPTPHQELDHLCREIETIRTYGKQIMWERSLNGIPLQNPDLDNLLNGILETQYDEETRERVHRLAELEAQYQGVLYAVALRAYEWVEYSREMVPEHEAQTNRDRAILRLREIMQMEVREDTIESITNMIHGVRQRYLDYCRRHRRRS